MLARRTRKQSGTNDRQLRATTTLRVCERRTTSRNHHGSAKLQIDLHKCMVRRREVRGRSPAAVGRPLQPPTTKNKHQTETLPTFSVMSRWIRTRWGTNGRDVTVRSPRAVLSAMTSDATGSTLASLMNAHLYLKHEFKPNWQMWQMKQVLSEAGQLASGTEAASRWGAPRSSR